MWFTCIPFMHCSFISFHYHLAYNSMFCIFALALLGGHYNFSCIAQRCWLCWLSKAKIWRECLLFLDVHSYAQIKPILLEAWTNNNSESLQEWKYDYGWRAGQQPKPQLWRVKFLQHKTTFLCGYLIHMLNNRTFIERECLWVL